MIHKKLLEFQKLNITIEKDAINPHFKNSYSSLNEVLSKVKKPLNDLGILIEQSPAIEAVILDGNRVMANGLHTVLRDTEDDTYIESFVPFINATDMQKLGGAITYARRYSLISMLGLEDADDDGNTASAPEALPTIRR